MFSKKTVFVLGAGSSKDVGLPLGSELALRIAKSLDIKFRHLTEQISGDPDITDAYRLHAPNKINEYREAGCAISAGIRLAASIDNFIDNHRDNSHVQLCGKLGIVKEIGKAETASGLCCDDHPQKDSLLDFSKIGDSWFIRFFRTLSEGVSKSELGKLFDNIAIINFNYDRCMEHFLFHAIRAAYSLDRQAACSLMSRLVVHHPYGSLGPLEWQSPQQWIPYGGHPLNGNVLLKMASGIRTYTERLEETEELVQIREVVCNAQTLVFLGFAFHPQNLELLRPNGNDVKVRRIYGTAVGISGPDCEVIMQRLRAMIGSKANAALGDKLYLDGQGCDALFDKYSRSLASP